MLTPPLGNPSNPLIGNLAVIYASGGGGATPPLWVLTPYNLVTSVFSNLKVRLVKRPCSFYSQLNLFPQSSLFKFP
jgi:hypothetical protein